MKVNAPQSKQIIVFKQYDITIEMFCVTLCDLFYFQGVGKSTLARKLANTWNCILIDGK